MMETGQKFGSDGSAAEQWVSLFFDAEASSAPYEVAAVLDPLAWSDVHTALGKMGAEWLVLFTGPVDQEHAQVMPLCVKLERFSSTATYVFASMQNGGAVLVRWKKTEGKGLVDVVAQLSPATRAWLPDGQGVWFRWYNPVILQDFWPLSTPDQRRFILGEWLEGMGVFDPAQQRGVVFANEPKARAAVRLDISAAQLESLGEASFARFITVTARALQEEHPALPLGMLEPRVRQSVEVAEENGLIDEQELSRFARLDARTGWMLWNDAEALDLLHAPDKTAMEKVNDLEFFLGSPKRREQP